jgi:hypothetical protein
VVLATYEALVVLAKSALVARGMIIPKRQMPIIIPANIELIKGAFPLKIALFFNIFIKKLPFGSMLYISMEKGL